MELFRRVGTALFVAVLLCVLAPLTPHANSAEPPCFTVIVPNAPDDLSLLLQLADNIAAEPVVLRPEQKAWERYYRFFYHMVPGGVERFSDAALLVESGGQTLRLSLPAAAFRRYNNLLTLDLNAGQLTAGQPGYRVPLLVAMRVGLTLLLEGFVFFLFGFRQKRSWLVFLGVNLVTQGGLNAMLTGPNLGSYWMFGFIVAEIVILAAESAAFAGLLREHGKRRAVLCAAAANMISLVLGGLLIACLPV